MSRITDPRDLPEHEYYECGQQIAQRYRQDEPLRARGTISAWWGLSDDDQKAVHRACCGPWSNVDDLAVMQKFESEAREAAIAFEESEREYRAATAERVASAAS